MSERYPLQASVIIPTFADWDRLALCLSALATQTLAPEHFEIIVVNNSTDETIPESIFIPPNARIIWEPIPGSYNARNSAVAQALGSVLFFTDSDCIPDKNWLAAGLEILASHPEHDRVAGDIRLFPRGPEWRAEELYDRMFWLRQADYVKSNWGTTANLIVRRQTFDTVGPFATDTFSGGDRQWNQRANAIGSVIHFAPDTIIGHPARATFDELARKKRRLIGGRHRLKNRSGLRKYLPPVGLLIPSLRTTREIALAPDIETAMKLRLIWIDYRLRLVALTESIRLRWSSSTPERR